MTIAGALLAFCANVYLKNSYNLAIPETPNPEIELCLSNVLETSFACRCKTLKVTRRGKLMLVQCKGLKKTNQ